MDRNQVEGFLRDVYTARINNDLKAVVGAFASDARYELAGSRETSPVPGVCGGVDAIRSQMSDLIKAFEMSNHEIVSMVIDLPRVAVRWQVDVRSTATGKTARTEICDIIEMRDGKIASFTEFFDSALANRLVGA